MGLPGGASSVAVSLARSSNTQRQLTTNSSAASSLCRYSSLLGYPLASVASRAFSICGARLDWPVIRRLWLAAGHILAALSTINRFTCPALFYPVRYQLLFFFVWFSSVFFAIASSYFYTFSVLIAVRTLRRNRHGRFTSAVFFFSRESKLFVGFLDLFIRLVFLVLVSTGKVFNLNSKFKRNN